MAVQMIAYDLRPRSERIPVPDDQVRSAIANWGPRFTSQGVDPGDFTRVTSRLENWADWLDAWCANGDMHAGLAREAEDLGRRRTAGEAWVRAALSYHFAKFVWMLDQTRHRAAADQAVAAMAQRAPAAGPGRGTAGNRVRRHHHGRQPAAAPGRGPPAAGPAHRGPGLDQGRVLRRGERPPGPGHGHLLPRRARAGRDGIRQHHPPRLRGTTRRSSRCAGPAA